MFWNGVFISLHLWVPRGWAILSQATPLTLAVAGFLAVSGTHQTHSSCWTLVLLLIFLEGHTLSLSCPFDRLLPVFQLCRDAMSSHMLAAHPVWTTGHPTHSHIHSTSNAFFTANIVYVITRMICVCKNVSSLNQDLDLFMALCPWPWRVPNVVGLDSLVGTGLVLSLWNGMIRLAVLVICFTIPPEKDNWGLDLRAVHHSRWPKLRGHPHLAVPHHHSATWCFALHWMPGLSTVHWVCHYFLLGYSNLSLGPTSCHWHRTVLVFWLFPFVICFSKFKLGTFHHFLALCLRSSLRKSYLGLPFFSSYCFFCPFSSPFLSLFILSALPFTRIGRISTGSHPQSPVTLFFRTGSSIYNPQKKSLAARLRLLLPFTQAPPPLLTPLLSLPPPLFFFWQFGSQSNQAPKVKTMFQRGND